MSYFRDYDYDYDDDNYGWDCHRNYGHYRHYRHHGHRDY
jgi:hypothetical protein